MKAYTDINQSKKLAEILQLESADAHYWCKDGDDLRLGGGFSIDKDLDIPAWSLAALLCVLPFPVLYMEMVAGMILWCCECHIMETDEVVKIEHYNNSVDACYEMILKLHKLKML